MAQLGMNFDANAVSPYSSRQILPPDEYLVHITKSEMKDTKDNAVTGNSYLHLEMTILDGPYKNRVIYDRLNLHNQNPKTEEIARSQLSSIGRAVGVMNITDSEQIHYKPFVVRLIVREPRTDNKTGRTYDASNEVRDYRAPNGGAPSFSGQTSPQPQMPPFAGAAQRPPEPAGAGGEYRPWQQPRR